MNDFIDLELYKNNSTYRGLIKLKKDFIEYCKNPPAPKPIFVISENMYNLMEEQGWLTGEDADVKIPFKFSDFDL